MKREVAGEKPGSSDRAREIGRSLENTLEGNGSALIYLDLSV